jgi:hypothetical protein
MHMSWRPSDFLLLSASNGCTTWTLVMFSLGLLRFVRKLVVRVIAQELLSVLFLPRTPAASARGGSRHSGVRETYTTTD